MTGEPDGAGLRSMNPWVDLYDNGDELVLPMDRLYVDAYNSALTRRFHAGAGIDDDPTVRSNVEQYVLDTSLPPHPFGGFHDSPVLILLANPGVGGDDARSYDPRMTDRRRTLFNNLQQPFGEPFWAMTDLFKHYVDEDFSLNETKESNAYKWWREHTKTLVDAVGGGFTLEDLAYNVLAIEFHGYRSKSFMTPWVTFPSQYFGFHLVSQAMERGALIVVLRATRQWCAAVPGLIDYPNAVLGTSSTQAVHISTRNLGEEKFNRIVEVLRHSGRRHNEEWLDGW